MSDFINSEAILEEMRISDGVNSTVVEEVPTNFAGEDEEEETPPEVFAPLASEFRFVLDLAANAGNTKVPAYIGPDHRSPMFRDGLTASWSIAHGIVGGSPYDWDWLNPPYGHWTARWMERVVHFRNLGMRIVTLLPVKASEGWWHDYVLQADNIRFLRRRVPFLKVGRTRRQTGRFASAIAIFDGMRASHPPTPHIEWWDWRR